ncbi:hypothetical protein MK280_16575 [Myxococcota bacterium]|nr:hypothetical protein [Myxococcota bacterium]
MRWIERLKQIAGWDLFLEILAVGVLFALGAFVLITQSCQGETNARIKRANAIPAIQQEPTPAIDLGSVNRTKANEVRDLIAKELAHGASSEAIEQFFGGHEITRGSTFLYRGAETHPVRLFDATGFVEFSGP